MARVFKHTSEIVLSRRRERPQHAKAQRSFCGKQPRRLADRVKSEDATTKRSFGGEGHAVSQNESGPPTMMELFITLNPKIEVLDRLFVIRSQSSMI